MLLDQIVDVTLVQSRFFPCFRKALNLRSCWMSHSPLLDFLPLPSCHGKTLLAGPGPARPTAAEQPASTSLFQDNIAALSRVRSDSPHATVGRQQTRSVLGANSFCEARDLRHRSLTWLTANFDVEYRPNRPVEVSWPINCSAGLLTSPWRSRSIPISPPMRAV